VEQNPVVPGVKWHNRKVTGKGRVIIIGVFFETEDPDCPDCPDCPFQ